MARIAGVTLPKNKRVEIALTYIYGIGATRAKEILEASKVDATVRVKDLTKEQVNELKLAIDKAGYLIEGELRRDCAANVKRLKDIESYRGLRHKRGLPVRGQRTKTNNRTVRGNKRVTMGSGRRAAAQKT